jgi:hypothetical protein
MKSNEPNLTQNQDLDAFRTEGNLFDVAFCDLHLNIGQRCVFLEPKYPYEFDLFTIVDVQRNYRGETVYRIVADKDTYRFGSPCEPSKIRFID